MSENRRTFEHSQGGESEAKYMTTMLLNSTESVLPVLSKEDSRLNQKDLFALNILSKVLSTLDDDIELGVTHKADFKEEREDIEERVLVPAGSSDQDRELFTDHDLPNYIDGQSKIRLQFDKKYELADLTVDVDLVKNLGRMPLPEGIPFRVSFMITGNFSDDFYRKISLEIGLPSLHISYFIHFHGDETMYHNTLNVDIAPPNMPTETVEERMRRASVYSYSPDLIQAILEGKDVITSARGQAIAGKVHDNSIIQSLGLVHIPNVGPSRIFLHDDNKSIKHIEY